MRADLPLRTRIIVAAALFGAVMGTAFAVFAYFSFDLVEESFVEDLISSEFDAFIERYNGGEPAASLTSAHLRTYVEGTEDWDALPPALREVPLGHGELSEGLRGFQYEMREIDGRRILMVFDETRIETTEVLLATGLAFSVVILTTVAAWLGFIASRQLLEPVMRLAGEVRTLGKPGDRPYQPSGYADDEVGLLAHTIAEHQRRIGAFLEREREFTAQASHELRTPLTVTRTALDLMLGDPALTPALRTRLTRARRGAVEMGELVDALLALARDEHAAIPIVQSIDVAQLVDGVIREVDRGSVTLAVNHRPTLDANRSLFAAVVRNLIVNAIRHGGGTATVTVAEDHVRVEDHGPGLPADIRSRGGLGISIVERLCERYGWRFALESTPGEGTRATVHFA